MNIYKPGDRVFIGIDDNGNPSAEGSSKIEAIILAVCGFGTEYLVTTDEKMQFDAIVCPEDFEDDTVKLCYTVLDNISEYAGRSAAWIRPRFIFSKNKTNKSGEYRLELTC